MIATVPSGQRAAPCRMVLEHLLLGDLRELLNEVPGHQRDRWLLATLDMLMMSRPRFAPAVYLPVISDDARLNSKPRFATELPVAFEKLQRLRDRIVHRAPYDVIANELNADLCEYFDRSVSSVSCD